MNFNVGELILSVPPLLFALTMHELAHGYTAWKLGDPTAKNAGRLSMNPLRHLDILGVLAFIFFKIGWAKPVPVDPRNFRNPRQGMLITALAGPGINLVLAIASALLLRLALVLAPLAPRFILEPTLGMLYISVWINVMLAIFNLLPIPPLDGSRVVGNLLPPRQALAWARLEPLGFVLVLALFYTGILGKVIMPLIGGIAQALLGGA